MHLINQCLITVLLIFINDVVGQQKTVCNLQDDNNVDIEWNKNTLHVLGEIKKDVEIGTQLTGIQLNGVIFKKTQQNECSQFLTIPNENDNHVTITTKDFSGWDNSGLEQCRIVLLLDGSNCDNLGDAQNLNFVFNIIDVNLNAPVFSENVYDLIVPYPLPSGLDLTGALGISISSTDNDFSTKIIKYTISGTNADQFKIKELPQTTDKTFPMSLLTSQLINYQKEITLTVTATDDGEPSKNSQATINIKPDEVNSIPPKPEFVKSYTTQKIDLSKLNVGDEVLKIQMRQAYENLEISTGSDFFTATVNDDIVTINLAKTFGDDLDVAFMTIEVTATVSYNGNSVSSSTVAIFDFTQEATSTSTTETSTLTPPNTDSTPTPPDTGSTESTPPDTGSTQSTPPDTGSSTTPPDGGSTQSTPPGTGSTQSTPPDTGSSSTSTSSTPPDGSSTLSTPPDTDSTPPVSDSTLKPTESPPTDPDEDQDVGLLSATIVLGISTGVLLAIVGFGYYKYIYTPRKIKLINSV